MRLGGCCRVKGEEFVIIHRRASLQDKIQIIVDALKRHDLSDVYVLPSLRKMLDKDR
jgi:GGDEF domain-containing protein